MNNPDISATAASLSSDSRQLWRASPSKQFESYSAIDSTGTRVVITREVSAHKVDAPEFEGLRDIARKLLGDEPILTHRISCK